MQYESMHARTMTHAQSAVFFVFVPLELAIWIAESVIYRKMLRSERPSPHPVCYALCANGLSMAATFFSIRWVFPWV